LVADSNNKMYKSWPGLQLAQTIFARNNKGEFRSWMHEDINNKSTLLITAGDSWTWGDSLFDISMSKTLDHPDRVKFIYGSLIAEKLECDFVNLGKCAGSNFEILNLVDSVLKFNYEKYDQIFVIITLTENLRELKTSVWTPSKHDTLEEFLLLYEENMFYDISKVIEKYNKSKFLITRNFTHTFEHNRKLIDQFTTNKIWVETLPNDTPYPNDIRFLSGLSHEQLKQYLQSNKFMPVYKMDFVNEIIKSLEAIKWLEHSNFNHKLATKHPTIEAHSIWANYLYKNLM
jgi:hypothetical protein